MAQPLRVLIIEDSEDDCFLILRELQQGGYETTAERVETEEEFRAALAASPWDVIIADYSMPHWNGMAALEIVRASGADVPFILVSGTVGEDVAVEAMRAGAQDYIMKRTLTRLPHAVGRELREVQERRARREAEERYRAVVDNIPIGIALISPNLEVLSLNPRMAKWFPKAAVAERPSCYRVFVEPPGDGPCSFCPTVRALREGVVHEATTETPAGESVRHWRIVASPLRSPSGEVVAAVEMVEDITEQVRLEERNRQASKLEAIGTLAGGVAHDFNNLLTGIIGYSDLLLKERGLGEREAQDVREIRQLADRATTLVRQLLAFSRRQTIRPEVIGPNQLIENLAKMLRRIIGEDVELRLDLAPDAGPVRVDPGQMEQVIVNLAVNARDAMPTGGVLTIGTANVSLQGRQAEEAQVEPGLYCLTAVSDTGCGMDEATQARIYEPFFTTKEAGHGTGLGLATVYGIVTQHGGGIAVQSAPGRGTTFRVYLPLVQETADPLASQQGAPPAPGGSETILVVEDEEAVARVAELILTRHGYTVLLARNAAEASELLRSRGGEIALLLSDVVMPGMSGPALYRDLLALQPSLKVLFMSGYLAHPALGEDAAALGAPLVEKPFTPVALAQAVRRALDA